MAALEYVGGCPVSFGDSWLYSPLCLAGPVLHTFVQYLVTFCNLLAGTSEVISGRFCVAIENIGVDIDAKFCDSRSNGSGDIRGFDFVSN